MGKSTILNGFLKEKVAIISQKPETTRDNIRGILTEDDCQIVFVDTPGIHKPHDLLGKLMLSRAQSTLMESDIILFVTEKNIAFNSEDELILQRLPEPDEGKKVILVINKVDKVRDKKILLPLIDKATKMYPFEEIVPICALKQADIDRLLELVKTYIPEGPFFYPEDQLTDKSERFAVQEIIREKVLKNTYQEVPHSVAVVVDDIAEEDKITRIYATIYVERTSQRSIVIGKSGSMIKKIGEEARPEIEELLSKRVHLDLWVKVFEKWKKDPRGLKEMGYSD